MAGKKRKMPDETSELKSGSPAAHQDHRTAPEPGPRPRYRPAADGSSDGYFRRLYETDPDFRQLAKQDARFAAV